MKKVRKEKNIVLNEKGNFRVRFRLYGYSVDKTFKTQEEATFTDEQCKTNIDEYKTFSTYLTDALVLNDYENKYTAKYDAYSYTNLNTRDSIEQDGRFSWGTEVYYAKGIYIYEGDEFVNDYRYSLFVIVNNNSVRNINYDLTALENFTDAFELLKAMNIEDYYQITHYVQYVKN